MLGWSWFQAKKQKKSRARADDIVRSAPTALTDANSPYLAMILISH